MPTTTSTEALIEDAAGTKRRAPGSELQAVGLGPHKDNDITENKLRSEFSQKVTTKQNADGTKAQEPQRPRY
jgi:hypothetical protein